MKLKIIKGANGVGRELLEVETSEARIVICFGEESGTGDIPEKVNPMIEGLTSGLALYDGLFVLRNPENCNTFDFALKNIPIYLPKKMRSLYNICMDFNELPKKQNINELVENEVNVLRDLEITPFIVDPSNFNTLILSIKDKTR